MYTHEKAINLKNKGIILGNSGIIIIELKPSIINVITQTHSYTFVCLLFIIFYFDYVLS